MKKKKIERKSYEGLHFPLMVFHKRAAMFVYVCFVREIYEKLEKF